VKDYPIPGETSSRWTVFGRDGLFLGTVDLPPRLQVFEIDATSILGLWRDDLDVEYVRVYSLVPVP
jgi:hypothetical protein